MTKMKVDIPKNSYIKSVEINDTNIDINFADRKKVALLFISLNPPYWPYLTQVIKDCRKNFLPHHNVDYFAWTDFNTGDRNKEVERLKEIVKEHPEKAIPSLIEPLASVSRLYEYFYPEQVRALMQRLPSNGLSLKRDGMKVSLETTHAPCLQDTTLMASVIEDILNLAYTDMEETLKGVNIIETDPVPWPAPTLMRYHLFLNEHEKLKDYDYVFYLDADMRVVSKVSDEILNDGILAAEHPMYSLRKEYIPPYEPNPSSTAYIKRPGRVVDEDGKPRFKPYYYAGGFQGETASAFLEAMQKMKDNIDKDFNNNYVAIWNDESHWNKYLSDYEGDLKVLDPSYVHPDSLVDEYYVKIWGRKYEPKIITLTKPFTLSEQGASAIRDFTKTS